MFVSWIDKKSYHYIIWVIAQKQIVIAETTMKVELDLFNYATKSDVRKETGVDTSNFAKKANLTSLKSDVDKVDIYKLKTIPNDWSKLSNVADDDVVKKTVYDELARKVDTNGVGKLV